MSHDRPFQMGGASRNCPETSGQGHQDFQVNFAMMSCCKSEEFKNLMINCLLFCFFKKDSTSRAFDLVVMLKDQTTTQSTA